MQTVTISRGIMSAVTAPTHNSVDEFVRDFRSRSKRCIQKLHETAIGNICQWVDASFAIAACPAHLLYQGIPTAVVQGSIDADSVMTLHRAAKSSFKIAALSSSDCLSVESFLMALNMHAIYKHQEPNHVDDDAVVERGTFWKMPRSTSKSVSIACVCNWFKTSGQSILLWIDCFEKISTHVLADIVAILWTARFELPVVMLLMSQCDSETIRQALSFSKSRHLRISHFFRLPSPSEQLEHYFSSVLLADNSFPLLLDPQCVILLRNRFHQTERIVDSFVDGIVLSILLHSYHKPNASHFFEFHAFKSICFKTGMSLNDETTMSIRDLSSRINDADYISEMNKLASIASSKIEISKYNVCYLFGHLCVRMTAYYAVPTLFRALLTSHPTRLTDIWGDTLVSSFSNPIWDGVELGDGCESVALEKVSHIDRIRFILWTCTPEVARQILESFEAALSQACDAIQAEHEFVGRFIRQFFSADDDKIRSSDNFLADIPVMLEGLKQAQRSVCSLAALGENGNWEAPFIAKSRDNCEPSSSSHMSKRRKILGTATVKAACGSNRVNYRQEIFSAHVFTYIQHL
jgi:hypothetical protein